MADFVLKNLDAGINFIASNYKPIVAALTTVYGIVTIKNFTREHHELHYSQSQKDRTAPLDPSLFPQWFQNAGGLRLYVRRWLIPNPKGLVFLSHGFQEHIGRYEHVAIMLNKAGYSVVGMDHQGHGQSQGDRYHVSKFQHFVEDYIAFVEREQAWCAAEYGPYGHATEPPVVHHGHQKNDPSITPPAMKYPCFLLGHSMGGLIASLVAIHMKEHTSVTPFSSVVLSAPCIDVDPALKNPVLMFVAKLLSVYLPKLPVSSLSGASVSTIPQVQQMYNSDILKGNTAIKARMAYELLQATLAVHELAPKFDCPLLVMHSTIDKLCVYEASQRFFNKTSSTKKQFVTFEKSEHELFNDIERQLALSHAIVWFNNFVGKTSSK